MTVEERAMQNRVPVQASRNAGKPPGTITWAEHLKAYEGYFARFGACQTAERLAERGGFSYCELVEFLGDDPKTWLANGAVPVVTQQQELERLRSELKALKAQTGEPPFGLIATEYCARQVWESEKTLRFVFRRQSRGKWAVNFGSFCLTQDGTLEHEPSPSNRTEEFLERCRFTSLDEAVVTYNGAVANGLFRSPLLAKEASKPVPVYGPWKWEEGDGKWFLWSPNALNVASVERTGKGDEPFLYEWSFCAKSWWEDGEPTRELVEAMRGCHHELRKSGMYPTLPSGAEAVDGFWKCYANETPNAPKPTAAEEPCPEYHPNSGRRKCSAADPYTTEKGEKDLRWYHPDAAETADLGEVARYKCPHCGESWKEELPR